MIVRMDGIVVKVRDNGRIINKTVYLCVGLKQNGLKEVLGMWVGKSESSSFRIGVLTDLKARGVQDILITYADNLNGFTDTIRTVFPSYSLNTKSKLSFPSDDAVKKMVYLSLMEIEKKWTQPIHNWGLIMNQFMLMFENRIQI